MKKKDLEFLTTEQIHEIYTTANGIMLYSPIKEFVGEIDGYEKYNKIRRICAFLDQIIIQRFFIGEIKSTIDFNDFSQKLCDKFGEGVDDDKDENNPLDWWLHDVTVNDIVEFIKEYK